MQRRRGWSDGRPTHTRTRSERPARTRNTHTRYVFAKRFAFWSPTWISFAPHVRFHGGAGCVTESSESMATGTVKFFNDQKGFGFVMPDSGSGDIYLHASALRRSGVQAVEPDQRIRYSTRQGNKGVEVDRVEII